MIAERVAWVAAVGVVALAAAQRSAAEQPARVVAAKATSPAATFTARLAGANEFSVLPDRADLFSSDLLVTLPGATLESKNRAASLKSLADYDGKSPLPTLETAFTLREPKDTDLALTLDRGRVDLTNTKADGPAVVRVRFWGQEWKITLDSPGSRVALELCGRWPPGARFKPRASGVDAPTPVASLVLLVVKGSAAVSYQGLTLGLKAPPGPALVGWDSVEGTDIQPQKLEKLPDWADPDAALSADGQKAAAAVEKFRQARAANSAAAVRSFLDSTDPIEQRVALVTLGATDQLDALGRALRSAKSAEEWGFGVSVVRHWLGRCPGQDRKLYEFLISPAQGFAPGHARTILQLLFGFGPDDLRRPETYDVLIEYLNHDQSAIRNLAAWHLIRLVPQGKGIPFKPNGTKQDCEAAYREWRKLVPPGKLPPPPPKKG